MRKRLWIAAVLAAPSSSLIGQSAVISGTAKDCFVPGQEQAVRALGVSAFDPASNKNLVAVLRSLDTLVKSFGLDDEAGVSRWNSDYAKLKTLWTTAAPLAHDSTSQSGRYSLTVPLMDSVLVLGFTEVEDEIYYYQYRMVGARSNVSLLLDMSKGGCGLHSDVPNDGPGTIQRTAPDLMPQRQHSDTSAIASRDSALNASEDSILAKAIRENVVAPNGDTIRYLGGWMMEAGTSKVYGIDRYIKNSTLYIRIQRVVGRKPDGNAIWLTRARLRLPPMDSTDAVTEAFCKLKGKPDSSIIAVTSTAGDSVEYHARNAWRFDRATETLREIPAAGVTCSPLNFDPD